MLLALGGSGALLYSLRSIPNFLYRKLRQRFIYTVTIYQYEELFDVLESYLSAHYPSKYRDVEAKLSTETVRQQSKELSVGGLMSFTRVKNKVVKRSLMYTQEVTGYFIKYNNKRIFVNKTKEKMEKAGSSLRDSYLNRYILSSIGGRKSINLLLEEAADEFYTKMEKDVVSSSYHSSYGEWYVGKPITVKTIEKVVLKNKEDVLKDVNSWESSEGWYKERGIPYKRGYCFYGPPGTGKTTLALAIAHMLSRDVYSLNLNTIDDDSKLNQIFANMPSNALLLIEDIDRVFSGRESVTDKIKVGFSTLLNCLDGAMYKHGLVTIITTNHIEKLDPALLRPGRMDVRVKVDKPDAKDISEYMSLFFKQDVEIPYTEGWSMTEVQEICMQNKDNVKEAIHEILKPRLNGKMLKETLEEAGSRGLFEQN